MVNDNIIYTAKDIRHLMFNRMHLKTGMADR